ncbi:N4-gp56 family major capsid protein [Shewanella cutis]|uniref:N4-gp56 family major capsid protein n=1 Tax=Shewanella cutis TaxID=2766780 RepID=A0ABS9QW72_9GAMM|nr:N4-gp56 family major capsid protein [Shewanella sp. PS-2]MCG9964618.1 N4-gp56 family major capsid protein [Shewanella sp. PS-2]
MANNYGDIGARVGVYAEKKMLEHAEPILVLNKLGDHKPMPKNTGEVIKFRRPIPLPAATTPIAEGVRPAATNFRYADVQATLQQYGSWMPITDKVVDLHEDPVGSDMAMMAGEQAAETVELITYGKLIAGTNVVYANGAARNAVNTPLSIKVQRLAVRTLMAQRAKRITSILAGSPNYATKPIEAAYVAVCHTDVVSSVRKMPGFTPVAEYGNRQPICAEEVGSVEDVRYIASPLFNPWVNAGGAHGSTAVTTGGTNADVYPVLFMGAKAFGCIPLKGSKEAGGAIKPMVRNPGSPSHGDEMGQNGSVAWKTWYTALILNDAWLVRGEVAASVDPT